MSTSTLADPSTVLSVTIWWKARKRHDRQAEHCERWWYSIEWDNYASKHDPFPADLMSDADTVNDAVVAIAARVGVIIGPNEVTDWYPDRSASWRREG